MRVLVYHPDAKAELEAEIGFCERERRGAGSHLRADITETLRLLLEFPAIGRLGDAMARRIVTNRYHFILHYELTGDQIVVWAVAHPKREPGYWRHRRPV
jgi:plasmid stabilization system protein ParE